MLQSPFAQASGLWKYIGLFLSGVCHQFPEHSLLVGGVQMPLCARCSGMFLGASLSVALFWLRGRSRASLLPPLRVLVLLGAFAAAWAVDGTNSYLHFLTGRAILYPPSNVLRLSTGMLQGLALATVVWPMFNSLLWQAPAQQAVIRGWRELAAILLAMLGLGLLLWTAGRWMLYPIGLALLLGVLGLLALVNSMIVVILLRWENRAQRWRQALWPLALGLVLALGEVGGIAVLRSVVGAALV
jgi:uncharacterized membrane protein